MYVVHNILSDDSQLSMLEHIHGQIRAPIAKILCIITFAKHFKNVLMYLLAKHATSSYIPLQHLDRGDSFCNLSSYSG